MAASLLLERGGKTLKVVPLEGELVQIGRVIGNDIVLNEENVSKRHAQLRPEGQAYMIEDLSSTIGTFVNGAPVTRQILHNGDAIRIGSYVMRFVEESQDVGKIAAEGTMGAPQSGRGIGCEDMPPSPRLGGVPRSGSVFGAQSDLEACVRRAVFVSYSSKDRAAADELCRLFEEQGIGCWIAPRDCTPGKPYGQEIIRAIESTEAFVLVMSEHANDSFHVMHEVERAVSKRKPIFPVRIREVQPSQALELFVSGAQWVDAWPPPIPARVGQLVTAIKALLTSSPETREIPMVTSRDKGGKPSSPVSAFAQPAQPDANLNRTGGEPPALERHAIAHDRFTAIPGRTIQTGFSTLFPVLDRESGHTYLMKKVRKVQAVQPPMALTAATIGEDCIAAPVFQWEDEESSNEVLPMIDGWTLSEILSLNKGVFGEFLTHWCRALLRLVDVLQKHDPPLVHRDIKPVNIMVRRSDLSSLVLIDCTTMMPYPVPRGVIVQGTPGFAPEEAMAGAPTLNSDVYSVGCTVFALNRAEHPPSPTERRHFGRTMELLHAEHPVEAAFAGMVALDPETRWPDAASALLEMKHSTWSQTYCSFDDLVLPDGRRLPHGGWF